MIQSAWTIIASGAEVITGARKISLRINRLLAPELLSLSEADRRRLLGLNRRVECLVQPLNFLLLWSKNRDSCVHQIVLNAQELLCDVCAFVDRQVPQEGSNKGGSNGAATGEIDQEQLEYYLKELDFACSSINMAVSLVRVMEVPHAPAAMCSLPASGTGPPTGSWPLPLGVASLPTEAPRDRVASDASGAWTGPAARDGVSLAALLRSSRRIQEMQGRTGDLCACSGRLYSLVSKADCSPSSSSCSRPRPRSLTAADSRFGTLSPAASGARERRARSAALLDSSGYGQLLGREEDAQLEDGPGRAWQPVLSTATFRVRASMDAQASRSRYSILVQSRKALSENPGAVPQQPVARSLSACDGAVGSGCGSQPDRAGMNAVDRLSFPIEAAEGARLLTTASIALPAEQTWCTRDLGVDSLVLVWEEPTGDGSEGGIVSGQCQEFPDAVLLAQDVSGPQGRGRRQARPAAQSFGSATAAAAGGGYSGPPPRKLYAFVFDCRLDVEKDAEAALTPLDALYLARLCALDDSDWTHPAQQDGEAAANCPPHLLQADEVLSTLLGDIDSATAASLTKQAMVNGASASTPAMGAQDLSSSPPQDTDGASEKEPGAARSKDAKASKDVEGGRRSKSVK
eukprot:TRINITY_DN26114_c0_g1_i1.p1 TRINITY_DN26114_c0_g1~~TRINITY_DN26114_c0_g1_i1.p1  ORF type:complete len:631 (-),score=123.94 TRINITY_DN26114_c0_g1_i1:254-2146(-)